RGHYCGVLVIAAPGEPDILLPPITLLAIGRDVTDQLFLKLADVGMSSNTVGDDDFVPQLAARWDWTDTVTLTFHLDPRARWKDGESLELAADSMFFLGRPHLRRLIWRFTPNLDVAVTQLIAGQADAIEVLGPPDNVKRVHDASALATYPYHGTAYGFLAFNL